MNSLFVGILYREEEIDWLNRNSKTGLQVAANNFQWNFIKGLEANLLHSIDIISTLSLGSYPKSSRKFLVRSKTILNTTNHFLKYIGFLNFYLIKGFCRFILLSIALRRWINDNPGGTIYVYSLYSPYLFALSLTKKHRSKNKVKYCLIVPDLMGKYGMLQPIFTIKGFWDRIESNFIYELSRKADCYVFLTKYMAAPLNIGNKPYTVIEGLISAPKTVVNTVKGDEKATEKKTILYTGSLLNDFGIETLLKSFIKIKDINYELWICGPLNESQTVIEYTAIDNRIKYFGFLRKELVTELQQKATVLINPRPNTGEYVKYSFPSKTMEYLVSGKPVIMFKLAGIPEDYYNHLFFIHSNDVESMVNTILFVCEKSDDELKTFGHEAKKFILKNKSCKIQTKKIIDLIKNMTF